MEVLIFVDSRPDKDEFKSLEGTFGALGLEHTVETSSQHGLGGPELPWLITVSLPLSVFTTTLAKRGASAVVDGLRRITADLYETRRDAGAGTVVLSDSETHNHFVLTLNLPDEALAGIFSSVRNETAETLTWSNEAKAWTKPN